MIDFCVTEDDVLFEQDIDLVVQQIDILLDTKPRDVLGEPNYGCDYYRFLYETNIGANGIAGYIENHIRNSVDLLSFNLQVKCSLHKGTENDIILVYIKLIAPEGYFYQKTYNISQIP